MSYSTQSLIESKIGPDALLSLTDKENTGAIDTASVARKLAAADSYIHSYIMARYSTVIPWTTAPAIITDMATIIATFLLYEDSIMGVPENRQKEFDRVVSYLKDIQSGKATIDGVTIVRTDTRNQNQVLYDTERTRVFSRENLTGM